MSKVEIFTQQYCPYCVRAVALLSQKNVPFEEIDAPRGTPQREEAMRRSGGKTTVPQIFVDGRAIGGCSELFELEHKGELDALLGRAA